MAKPKKDTNSVKHLTAEEWKAKSPAIEGWSIRTNKLLEEVLVDKKNVKDMSAKYEVSRQYIYKTVDRFYKLFEQKD